MTNSKPLPVHIPAGAPEIKLMDEARLGGLRYRMLIDGSGGPTNDLCQGIFYLRAGHAESPHSHEVPETIYVLSGHGHAILGDQHVDLASGDTLFIPAGQMHGFEAAGDMEMLYTFPTARFADVTYTYAEAA